MYINHENITSFFEEKLNNLECHQDTKAYIISIFTTYKTAQFDFSKESITALYAQARSNRDFLKYQNVGNWILYINTIAPTHFRFASKDYYDTIAKLSYYSCYKITDKKWKLYQQLADEFNMLENQIKKSLTGISF